MNDPSSTKTSPLYIFDFCGTLFEGNTTVAFLQFVSKSAALSFKLHFYARWVVAGVLRRLRLVSGVSYMRIRIGCLRGFKHCALNRLADEFANRYLPSIRRNEEFSIMQKHLAAGDRVVIASYSLDFIIESVARHLGVKNVFAAKLEYDDEWCTGRYADMIRKTGKLRHLMTVYDAETIRNAYYFTDDPVADADLISFVRNPVIIPKRRIPGKHILLREALLCFPGVYYYTTRYQHSFERVLHILKYWVIYPVLLWTISALASWPCSASIIIAWLAFVNVYDIFARENDELAAVREKHPTKRQWHGKLNMRAFSAIKIVTTIMLLSAICLLNELPVCLTVTTILMLVSVVFAIHNRANRLLRMFTFLALYLTKGLLFLPFFISTMTSAAVLEYLIFVFMFNISYLPSYITQKVCNLSSAELTVSRLGLFRFTLILPFFYKNALLLAASLVYPRYLAVLLLINCLTALEWAGRAVYSRERAAT